MAPLWPIPGIAALAVLLLNFHRVPAFGENVPDWQLAFGSWLAVFVLVSTVPYAVFVCCQRLGRHPSPTDRASNERDADE